MEVGVRCTVQAEAVEQPAALCLPGATVAGILNECLEDTVTVETDGAKAVLTVGRDWFEVFGMGASGFPDIPDLGEGPTITTLATDLKDLIDRTIFAAAREQGRYAINGLYMQAKDKALEAVATDGRRLTYSKLKLKTAGALDEGIIVPVKMMQEVRKLTDLLGEKGEIQFGVRGRLVLFRGGAITLSSVLVEGIFPKYQQVIPKNCDKDVTVKREALLLALRKARFLASDETRAVRLRFTPGVCALSASTPDKGEAEVTVEAEHNLADFAISVNPAYLSEGLSATGGEDVKLEFAAPEKPMMVRQGADYTYVLMPTGSKE
jgi:DNA polymerase-3 subunit beta